MVLRNTLSSEGVQRGGRTVLMALHGALQSLTCARYTRMRGPNALLTQRKGWAHFQEETRPREVKQPVDAQVVATGLGLPTGSQAGPDAPGSGILDGPAPSP